MKKFLLAAMLLAVTMLPQLEALDILAEGKVGYFYPVNHKFRRIYDGDAIYGGEVTIPVNCWNGRFALFTGASYFSQNGRSSGLGDRTKVRLVPVTLGMKYFIPIKFRGYCADFYVGAGAAFTYLSTTDHSPFVIKHVRKWGLGGVYKAGLMYQFCNNFYVDLFVDYYDKRYSFHKTRNGAVTRVKADVSGISSGIGIGYKLGCAERFFKWF